MNDGNFIIIGVMVFGFVANAFYMKGVFGTKLNEHDRRLGHIEEKVVWQDTCLPKHEEVNRRLIRLEDAKNNE